MQKHLSLMICFVVCGELSAQAQSRCAFGNWNALPNSSFVTGQSHAVVELQHPGRLILVNGGAEHSIVDGQKTALYHWENQKWNLIDSISGPQRRNFFAASGDQMRNTIVLYGGVDSKGTYFTDTWEWNGSQWLRMLQSGPGPREGALMCYDPKSNSSILFGGIDDSGNLKRDTWRWNGKEWTEVKSAAAPSARFPGALFYDPISQAVYLYGGHNLNPSGFEFFNDLWRLKDGIWTQMPSNPAPGIVYRPSVTYLPSCGKILLAGGLAGSNEKSLKLVSTAWEWTGTGLSISSLSIPIAMSSHTMSYDEKTGSLVLHGGHNIPGGKPLNGTFTMRMK